MYNYDVFISRKEEDREFAKILYDFLTQNGFRVFESNHSLKLIGDSDYRKVIDEVLTSVEHLIVVTSSSENVTSPWVEAEWGFFINRKRTNKTKGNIFTLLVEDMTLDSLPASLGYYSAIKFNSKNFDDVLCYLGSNKLQTTNQVNSKNDYNEIGNKLFTEKNYKEAYQYFLKGAEYGDPASQTNVGYLSFFGLGVFQNTNSAIYWYGEASEKGNIQAMKNLAVIYEFGQGGIKIDHQMAYKYYFKAATLGDSHAQFRVGLYNYDGRYFKQDNQKAYDWFYKSAQTNAAAQNMLGVMFERGQIISDKQFLEAFRWYSEASKNNDILGLANVARCYLNGIGTSINPFAALNFYSKSAKLGNIDSALMTANLYYDGIIVVRNFDEAAYYFAVAADLGSATGMYRLGLIYYNGTPTIKIDLKYARELFTEAAKRGNTDAIKILQRGV